MGKIEFEKFCSEIVDNIRSDRDIVSGLLADAVRILKTNSSVNTHKEIGLVASKYAETLQRSNEQLVKVAGLVGKNKENGPIVLTDEEKEEILNEGHEEE